MLELIFLALVAPLVLSSTLEDSRLAKLQGFPKIMGGQQISIDLLPYNAALIRISDRLQFCGSSVISEYWIMTAAHCTYKESSKSFFVLVGFDTKTAGGDVKGIRAIIQHKDFNNLTVDFDIALLHLQCKMTFSRSIKSAGLPLQDELISDGSFCIVSGWGKTMPGNGTTSDFLVAAYVPTVNQESCQNLYRPKNITITDNMFCAGWAIGGTDSCQGSFEMNYLAS